MDFATYVQEHYGSLSSSSHEVEDGSACALEALSAYQGGDWTDDPTDLHIYDIRPLNDAQWSSDAARTAALVPLVEAYAGSLDWPPERQYAVIARIVERTIREVLPLLLRPVGLRDAAKRCEREGTAVAAAYAADAASRAAAATIHTARAAVPYGTRVAAARAADAAARAADAAACAADADYAARAAAAATRAAAAAAYAAYAADLAQAPRTTALYASRAASAASYAAHAAAADAILSAAVGVWLDAAR